MWRRTLVLSVCLAACSGGEGGGGGALGGADGGGAIGGAAATGGAYTGGNGGSGNLAGSGGVGGAVTGGTGGDGGSAGVATGGAAGSAGAATGGAGGTAGIGGAGGAGGVGGAGGNGGTGGACSPNCNGLGCGPDPVCGTSCGTCGAGSTCLSGNCCANGNLCSGACCGSGQTCNGGSCCTPSCNGKTCGSDGCNGTCGTCGAGTSCIGNSCCATSNVCNGSCCASGQVCNGGSCCTPSCSGKTCGSNGCGGSCGSCGTGQTCNTSGQCVTCTTPGATQCVTGNPFSVRTCTNGNWVQSSCPSYQACATNSCKSLCDGMLSSTLPRACFFPVNESGSNGVYFYTNNTTKLPVTILDGYVGDSSSDAPIYSSGQTWPYAWTISQLDAAIAGFKLQNFTFQVQKVTLYFRTRRSGIISNTTNVLVAASDGAIFASGTVPSTFAWGTNNIYVSGLLAQQFNYNTAWNFMDMAPTGDGFGNPPDLLDVNWYLLEVQQ